MTNKEITLLAVEALKAEYPEAVCSLTYKNAYELLIATRLSAQCTDARVNMVTPALFKRFPTPFDLANGEIAEVEELIKTCGLYKTKAKDLIGIGKMLYHEYNSVVPDTIEELTKLPGVGRKTANLVCGDIYKKSAVVTDTHFIRITNRLGLVNTTNPRKVEDQMRKLLPSAESNDFCHRTVLHGRSVCKAQKPLCNNCVMNSFCKKKGVKKVNE